MNKKRQQRLIKYLFGIIVLGIGLGLVLYILRSNINVYYTPSQLQGVHLANGTTLRLGGLVVPNTIKRSHSGMIYDFQVTDGHAQIAVHYHGIVPNLFAEGKGVVVQGTWNGKLVLATQVLAKHDEKYQPPGITGSSESMLSTAVASLPTAEQ